MVYFLRVPGGMRRSSNGKIQWHLEPVFCNDILVDPTALLVDQLRVEGFAFVDRRFGVAIPYPQILVENPSDC